MMRTVGIFGVLLAGSVALGQDLGIKAPAQSTPIVIENATIHTVGGETFENGYIAFDKGVITGVGAGKAPGQAKGAGTQVIDGKGKHVYPGLISAYTLMGLTEISAVRATNDFSEVGSISPEVRAAVAVNPDSTVIPVTRSNGILTVGVVPMGELIPGRASVMRMDGWTWEDMAVEDDAGLIVNWPNLRATRGWWVTVSEEEQKKRATESVTKIEEAFATAKAYIAARATDPDNTAIDIRWEAMRDAIDGKAPVFIRAQELEQIESAVSWAVKNGLRPIIVGGRDAGQAIDLLKRHDVGVLITGTFRLPRRDDTQYDDPYTLPARLEAAGVRWCLGSSSGMDDTAYERSLPYEAGMAAAFGLSPETALKGITLYSARMLGVDDQLGSLEPGKAATLIVTTGDPLEVTTNTEMAFIDGRAIDLSNKQSALEAKYREKYRQLGILKGENNPAPATKQ